MGDDILLETRRARTSPARGRPISRGAVSPAPFRYRRSSRTSNGLVGFAGKAAYNSAKHGVVGLTRVAALEGAPHGVTVNALCSGYVDTPLVRDQLADLARTRDVPLERVLEDVIFPLVPMRRLLSPRDVADYVVFLASEKASCVTGQAGVVDGGYTAQ